MFILFLFYFLFLLMSILLITENIYTHISIIEVVGSLHSIIKFKRLPKLSIRIYFSIVQSPYYFNISKETKQ